LLLDAEITIPKFASLIKVSEKNIQSYKKKGEVPNMLAVIAKCFAEMNKEEIDYRKMITSLELKKKSKNGGFKKKNR
jgi:L-2-hydroxyglutarate oxidase LhgO